MLNYATTFYFQSKLYIFQCLRESHAACLLSICGASIMSGAPRSLSRTILSCCLFSDAPGLAPNGNLKTVLVQAIWCINNGFLVTIWYSPHHYNQRYSLGF